MPPGRLSGVAAGLPYTSRTADARRQAVKGPTSRPAWWTQTAGQLVKPFAAIHHSIAGYSAGQGAHRGVPQPPSCPAVTLLHGHYIRHTFARPLHLPDGQHGMPPKSSADRCPEAFRWRSLGPSIAIGLPPRASPLQRPRLWPTRLIAPRSRLVSEKPSVLRRLPTPLCSWSARLAACRAIQSGFI